MTDDNEAADKETNSEDPNVLNNFSEISKMSLRANFEITTKTVCTHN